MNGAILIVDDDPDLLFLLGDIFTNAGLQFVSASSLETVKGLGQEALSCRLAILDINLGTGQPSGVEIYHYLKENKFQGQIVFFTGHATWHPEVMKARQLENVQVIEKPAPISTFMKLVERV